MRISKTKIFPLFLALLATGLLTPHHPRLLAEEDKKGAGKTVAPPSDNLLLGEEVPKASRKSVEDAIAAFKKAEGSKNDRDRLVIEAVKRLETACSNAPKSPVPHYYLGVAYQIKKNFPRAKTALEKAVKLNPHFHEAFVELGDVYIWQKDVKGSLPFYDKALKLKSKYLLGMERKAGALIRLGRLEEAKALYEKVEAKESTPLREAMVKALQSGIKGPDWGETFKVETENYQLQTPVSQEFAAEVAEIAELMRAAYSRVFPTVKRPERKYEIWVFKDKAAYHRGGGPPMAGGHYSPIFRRLFLFKYPKKEDTFLVLRHEAFHQFLHDYMELAPSWFNEGLADYFGAFQHERQGGVDRMVSRPNSWRLQAIQYFIPAQRALPSVDLMQMTQAEMYDPEVIGVCYAQSWAMFYFIFENNKYDYKNVVSGYFNALTKGHDPEKAFEQSFAKINLSKFDKEWKNFIMSVKN
ncbi:MAG: tetratricopeptide repeat protein [Planctomycetes bacterium]|nr:tetratricopeptide repeat protein [Planctomycetota bacterium]